MPSFGKSPSRPIMIDRRRLIAAGAGLTAVLIAGNRVSVFAAQEPGGTLGWSDELSDNGQLNVATTVAPISSIVRNIGGTRINLRGIVPDGVNSHTFEPAPSDAQILAVADILIANGLQLEEPTMKLAEANLPEGGEIFTLGERTIDPDQYAYDFSFPEDGGKPNPHLWTNIPFAITYANLVAEKLTERDPDNADYYEANRVAYVEKLTEFDALVQETVDSIPEQNRKLLTYHDSWAYFSTNYGMVVVGAIQPSDFSEPSARDVADLIDQINEEQVPAIFGSEVFPSPVLEQIARETGAAYYDDLRDDDPPGEPGSAEHTFIGMMRKNLQVMAEGLLGDPAIMDAITPDDTFAS